MTRMNWIIAPERLGFWPRFAAKMTAALATCLAAGLLIAQAPPAAPTFRAKVEEDPNTGNKRLVLPPNLVAYQSKSAQSKLFRDKVGPVLSGQRPIADGRNDLQNYYELIYFPNLTQYSDDALRTLSDERIRFMRELEQSGAKAPEAHALLNGLTLNTMTNIVRDNFHPAVRYNAMLIISGLNEQEATGTGNKVVPAVPMSRARTVILEEFKRPENSDAIRMAALLGLTWHLEAESAKPPTAQPAPFKAAFVDELLNFVQSKEPPPGRSPEGHTWMRRRAVEALAIACLTKAEDKVATAMEALLRDDSEPLALRTTVAMALGKMSLQGLTIDAPALAKELGYVALLACDTELTRAITQRKDEAERMARLMGTYSGEMGGAYSGDGGMPGGGMPGMPYGGSPYGGSPDGGYPGASGGYTGPRPMAGTTGTMPGSATDAYGAEMTPDPSMMDPKHYRFDLIRRKMRYDLYCVQMGLTGGEDHQRPKAGAGASGSKSAAKDNTPAQDKRGLFAIAKPNEKQLVDNVYYDVRDLVDMIENRATDTFQLDREMRKRMTKLESQVGKRTPAAAAGAADEDLPGAVSAIAPAKAGGKAGANAAPVPGKGPAKPPAGKAPIPAKGPAVQQKAGWKAGWKAPPGYRPNNAFGSVRR